MRFAALTEMLTARHSQITLNLAPRGGVCAHGTSLAESFCSTDRPDCGKRDDLAGELHLPLFTIAVDVLLEALLLRHSPRASLAGLKPGSVQATSLPEATVLA